MSTEVPVGYCTNVHSGADLATTRANLERHAVAVKQQVCPQSPLGVGLWLSAAAAAALSDRDELESFAAWLGEAGLVPFTFNGFPYGDFHQPVVKHRVYEPAWHEPARRQYTLNLIELQHALLPPGMEGSISTLPLCWGQPQPGDDVLRAAAAQLAEVAERLRQLEADSGRLIYVCLEPEPGCVLDRAADVVAFFEQLLLPGRDERVLRRYLRVCHDVCHAAVMFEDQRAVFEAFRAAGIKVGKVQVSAAVVVRFGEMAPAERAAALAQLAEFAEDRYLHQTVVRDDNGVTTFHEDLPPLVKAAGTNPTGEWRVHFHVPVYLDGFGMLKTSQAEILACLEAARGEPELKHFEVETYAWGVLPESLQVGELATGIAQELDWFHRRQAGQTTGN